MFVAISDTILASVGTTLATLGFVVKKDCGLRDRIVTEATRSFPREDGNNHRWPKGYALKASFYPAYDAAGGLYEDKDGLQYTQTRNADGSITRVYETAKAAAKGVKTSKTANTATGARVKGSPEAKAWGQAMAAARAAKSGKTAPAKATAKTGNTAPKDTAPQSSGALSGLPVGATVRLNADGTLTIVSLAS